MAIRTSQAYRIIHDGPGAQHSLDGGTRLTTGLSDDSPGQRWRLRPNGEGTYALTNEALGPCYAVDVTNDGTYTPVLVPAADFTGQMWRVESLADGAFRLGSEFPADVKRWLGVDERGALVTRPGPAQRWRLVPLAPAATAPTGGRIPQLCPGGPVSQTEGHADYTLHLAPRGTLRAVVIFGDFNDAPGGMDPAVIGERVHGAGAAARLLHEQSYGVLALEVTVRSDLGWRRLPQPSTAYDFGDGRKQRQFMTDLAARIGAHELRFDDYDLVLAVTAYTTNVGLSPAYHHVRGDGAPSATGEILHGVTFGWDLYGRDHRVLLHELGHVMGLPDLYPVEPQEPRGTCRPSGPAKNLVGYWDLMSDVDNGEHFLGWHRHKNGWLPPARCTYLDQATSGRRITLHPLTRSDGLSMVVVPCDDVRRPRKVLVVEPAEGLQMSPDAQGVLIYSVDSGIDGGRSPVSVLPRDGAGLDDAPHRVGDVADIQDDEGARLRVAVHGRVGQAWDVEISFTPAPTD